MRTLVLKFGGAAVAAPERFSVIAKIIGARRRLYARVVVVVSAMGSTTDELLKLSQQVHPAPPTRELDMLLTAGERISIALLAMALDYEGISAISFTGSQSGIITSSNHREARIVAVKPRRLVSSLESGRVVIVAGFQGVSETGEITTLGRGGSDTSAVALAVALKAEKVEFYKDVSGIYTEDPNQKPLAELIKTLDFDKASEMMSKGAKVLHPRSVALAKKNHLPLHILSFHEALEARDLHEFDDLGTWIGKNSEGQNQYLYENSV